MNDLEGALKQALAKGDASDPAFRERVYRAAAGAVERAAGGTDGAASERLAERRRQLLEAIRAIEATYRAGTGPAPAETGSPEVVADRRDPQQAHDAGVPELRAEPRDMPDTPDRPQEQARRNRRGRTAPAPRPDQSAARRAPFATMLSLVVLFGLLALGGWWVAATGALQSAAERDTSVPNPPLRLDNEDFEGSRATGSRYAPALLSTQSADDGWITLFQPGDPTTLSLEGGASASIDEDNTGRFARLVSPDREGVIGIDIPAGTLRALAGKPVQFSIAARADKDMPTQMSVTCDFAELGDCGRLRFNIGLSDSEFLFAVPLPVGSASTAGRIRLNTDLENTGKAIILSSVRVREIRP